ncbi:MAG: hypothetical protein AB1422_10525 [bacterium]
MCKNGYDSQNTQNTISYQSRLFFKSFDLFIVSFVILNLELALIRWLPAYVRLLSFFNNFVLLACFLGMSIGCIASKRKLNLLPYTPSIFLIIILLVYLFNLNISFGEQLFKSEVYFGAEGKLPSLVNMPFEFLIILSFSIVVLSFIGLGQFLGNSFNNFTPIKAYTINILGSIFGILFFSIFSYLSLSPTYWFSINFILILYLLRKELFFSKFNLGVIFLTSIIFIFLLGKGTLWSPYYKIKKEVFFDPYLKINGTVISVNEITHQMGLSNRTIGGYRYSVPHFLIKDSLKKKFEKVLIIGSGMGNDVSHAIMNGAKEIDAVEIDPLIIDIGKKDHPDKPYSDKRVKIYNDDGRSFLKKSNKKYDFIAYGLVDSLTLLSTFSTIRLENYLFTKEAFEEVKAHLNEDGVFVIYNYFRKGWLALKIYSLLKEVFGENILVITLPSIKNIDAENPIDFVIFMAGNVEKVIKNFEKGSFYADINTPKNLKKNGFNPKDFRKDSTIEIFPVENLKSSKTLLPLDDWPFLYLREKKIPPHNFKGLAIIFLLSTLFLIIFTSNGSKSFYRISPHFFFLGTAFMILETESITKFALLFGSTWVNNSIVFLSILTMILFANLYVSKFSPDSLKLPYIALFISLLIGYLVPFQNFLGESYTMKIIYSGVIGFLPILFAGIIFATSFKKSREPQRDFGSNIFGAIIGGIVEYLSLIIGYHNLLIIVALFYLLSLISIFKKQENIR